MEMLCSSELNQEEIKPALEFRSCFCHQYKTSYESYKDYDLNLPPSPQPISTLVGVTCSHGSPHIVLPHTEGSGSSSNFYMWDFLVVQWLRIHLPMQGTQVCSLAWEDLTCRRTTEPQRHNYWAHALKPEKISQWEARALQPRGETTRESLSAATKMQSSQKEIKF